MKKGFGIVEGLIIVVVIILSVLIVVKRNADKKDTIIVKTVRNTVSELQVMLETYRISIDHNKFPLSTKLNTLMMELDKKKATEFLKNINIGDSLYISDGSSYTLIVVPKSKKIIFYRTYNTARVVFEDYEKSLL